MLKETREVRIYDNTYRPVVQEIVRNPGENIGQLLG